MFDDAVTQKDRTSAVMVNRVGDERPAGSQVHLPLRLSVHGTENKVGKRLISRWREKLLRRLWVPVPQTDAGGRGENPETDGRTLVKELGKMTP